MNKVLSIIGTTAVGKTAFALQLAAHILESSKSITGIDLISADSRQVYEGIEIISGIDLDQHWQAHATTLGQKYWQHQLLDIRFFGLSFLKPTEEWSVSHFQNLARSIIAHSHQSHRLPIIVGGTGLYLAHVANSELATQPPPNPAIREKAQTLTVAELQDWLRNVDVAKLLRMNSSDAVNPRRLVRAIEVASSPKPRQRDLEFIDFHMKTLGLEADFEMIEARIKARVTSRLSQGAIHEVETILALYPHQKLPIFTSTGVKPLLALLHEQINEQQCMELWFRQERQYAKRQLTWWKKHPDITWFSVTANNWQTQALSMIDAWLSA